MARLFRRPTADQIWKAERIQTAVKHEQLARQWWERGDRERSAYHERISNLARRMSAMEPEDVETLSAPLYIARAAAVRAADLAGINKADAALAEHEQAAGEEFKPTAAHLRAAEHYRGRALEAADVDLRRHYAKRADRIVAGKEEDDPVLVRMVAEGAS